MARVLAVLRVQVCLCVLCALVLCPSTVCASTFWLGEWGAEAPQWRVQLRRRASPACPFAFLLPVVGVHICTVRSPSPATLDAARKQSCLCYVDVQNGLYNGAAHSQPVRSNRGMGDITWQSVLARAQPEKGRGGGDRMERVE